MILSIQQLSSNIRHAFVSFALRGGLALFLVPYLANGLGKERYGVWVLLFQLLGYLALFDCGLDRAMTRFVSQHFSRSELARLNALLSTSLTLYAIIGTIVMGCCWAFSGLLLSFFNVAGGELLTESTIAFQILAIYLGFRFYFAPLSGQLGNLQRHDLENRLGMIEDICRGVGLITAIAMGQGLIALATVVLASGLTRHAAAIIVTRRIFPQVTYEGKRWDRETVSLLWKYARQSLVVSLGWLLLFGSDTLLVTRLFGPSLAAEYAPALQLMLYVRLVVNAAVPTLTTAFSHYQALQDRESFGRLLRTAVGYASFFAATCCSLLYWFSDAIVTNWLPAGFDHSAGIIRYLAIGTVFYVPTMVLSAALFATEKLRTLQRFLFAEIACKIGVLLITANYHQVEMIALSTAIPQILLYSYQFPSRAMVAMGYETSKFLSISAINVAMTALVVTACSYILQRVMPVTNLPVLLGELVTVALLVTVIWWWRLSDEERTPILALLSLRK